MPPALTFTDARGLTWMVYEVPASRIEFADQLVDESPAHLTFELVSGSTHVLKRLRPYPEDWRDMEPARLDALCQAAGPPMHRETDRVAAETRRHMGDLTT
ncbi:MAG TPA: hypothetical protein VJ596_02810 [Gemmatimonadaceae bacterium]|nr:hypothetical protein [Gemmatimonadaceae bacterium]